MSIVDQIRHQTHVLERYRAQIAHYRNVADQAEKLIVLLAEALNNPTSSVLAEMHKAETAYYEARRRA